PGAGTPTGTVTFFAGGAALGTGDLLVVDGVASAALTTSALPAGAHRLTAAYAGDGNVQPSASAALAVQVNIDLGAAPRRPGGGLDLRRLVAPGGSFVGLDLSGADLTGSRLAGADFRGARLAGATLTLSTLSGADFTGADLRQATVLLADLRGASFTDADLRGAVVVLADLRQAVWGNTLCPDGTNSDANGGT